jgi:hypothetical protein
MRRGANHERGVTASKGTLPSCKKLGPLAYKTVSYSRLLNSKNILNSATANEPPRRKQRGFLCHSVLDRACPVLDTGESSPFAWIPAGVYPPQAGRNDGNRGKPRGMNPK